MVTPPTAARVIAWPLKNYSCPRRIAYSALRGVDRPHTARVASFMSSTAQSFLLHPRAVHPSLVHEVQVGSLGWSWFVPSLFKLFHCLCLVPDWPALTSPAALPSYSDHSSTFATTIKLEQSRLSHMACCLEEFFYSTSSIYEVITARA